MHFIDILFVKYPRIIFGRYLKIVTFYPILSIFVTLSVSIFLTIYGLYFNCTAIDFDPKKGFETRGTFLSKARLTLEELKTKQAKNENILRWYFGSKIKNRIKRSLNVSSRTTIEPITVNYDDYGVDSEPNIDDLNDNCAEFGTFGKSIPFDAIEYLTKIMIQISSYDQLFTVSTMKHLCQIDSIIEQTIQKTNFTNNLNLLKSSLNIPLYITCPNITIQNSCNSIDQYNVDTFRKLIEMCQKNQTLSICEAFSINQVINWLLTKPNKNGEILISAVLKVTMWNGKDEEFYKTLIENFKNHFDLMNSTKFVGISCNMKEYLFQQELFNDILYSGISAFFVFFCFLLYSKKLIFTIIIILIVLLSAGVAFFVYTVILGIDFFPFINLLVIVILISIGADDAFLLLVYFRKEIKKMSNLEYKIGDIYVALYHDEDLISQSLKYSLFHSLSSMFITSFTTAITFLTNLTSSVIVLRCFGIYACITVVINYILVIFILPPIIILTRPVELKMKSDENLKIKSLKKSQFQFQISIVTEYFRYSIVVLTILLSFISIFIIFKNPGFSVPRTNPTKLLIDSDIHEFFDNNIHRFNFEWKRSARFVKNFLFGIPPIKELSSLSPYHKIPLNLSLSNYKLSLEKLEFYNNISQFESNKYKTENYNFNSWSDRFLRSNESCLEEKEISSNCIMSTSVKFRNFIHQFPDDFSVIPGNGPFISEDLKCVGYFISIPTNEKLRIDSFTTQQIFEQIDETCEFLKKQTNDSVICSSSSEITRFYDVISQLKISSLKSVLISIILCFLIIILCCRVLKLSIFACFVILSIILWTIATLILFGWQLSVVESTILIITIGLSFDYTLHYVISIKNTHFVPTIQKIQEAHSTAGIACSLGSLTLILAGFPLILLSHTASFYQVGSMLVVLGFISFFCASIVLPAFVLTFSCNSRQLTKL